VSTARTAELAAAVSRAREATGSGRAARIAELAEALRRGTYRPDPQRIADRILDDAILSARLRALLGGSET